MPAVERPAAVSADPGARDERLRPSGIRVLGDLVWGAHVSLFYDTKEDLLDACVPFLEAGLHRNETCVWAVSDPITADDAVAALRGGISGFDRYLRDGRIEILHGDGWYLADGLIDMHRIIGGWEARLANALSGGRDGLRFSGNVPWTRPEYHRPLCEYEHELDRSLEGRKMIALCTYPLWASRAADLLDIAREHHYAICRRDGEWEILQTAELAQAKREIDRLTHALDVLSKPFSGGSSLTPRERLVLAQIVRGASSKEAARSLGIAPRTVEFHRANIMKKLGTRNTADLVRSVLGG